VRRLWHHHVTTYLPKPSKAAGRFAKADFIYIARDDEYQCPGGQRLRWRRVTEEKGLNFHVYWTDACPTCALRSKCTVSKERRVRRWEHEEVLERVRRRLDRHPRKMTERRRTIEHVFGTLKPPMAMTGMP
jgi:hypothetical protein